jgi:glycosyltransferase involved in cell wall biosynthesis
MERDVVMGADRVIVVGNGMKNEFEDRYGRSVDVITNGYDADDFKMADKIHPDSFVIAHVGSLVPSRNPVALWEALGELANEDTEAGHNFKVRLTGKTDIAIREQIVSFGLESRVSYQPYIRHDMIQHELASAAVLLLVLNNTPNAKGILTGKLFEYMAAGRPVLCIGPVDGDAARVIEEAGCGVTAGFDDKENIKSAILSFYEKFRQGSYSVSSANAGMFTREALTGKLADILNQVTGN